MSLNPWIRLYREALHDPKLVTLPDRQYRAWVNCLLIADDNGLLPSRRDVAVHMRVSLVDADNLLCDLVEAGLIDADSTSGPVTIYRLHGWKNRQYAHDTSAERMRKHRAKKRDVTRDVTGDGSDVTGDAIESESYSDTDTESPDLPSSLDAARAEGRNDQRGLNKFGGRRQDGRHEKILRRAEGLGVPVDDLTEKLNQQKVKNRSAYFTTLCVEWFEKRLPGIDEEVIRSALWGTEKQYAAVMNLMVHAP